MIATSQARGLSVELELLSFADGALAVDLVTGAYYRLNSTAETICRLLIAGASAEQARAALTEHHRISDQAAAEAVTAVLTTLHDSRPSAEPVGPLRYGRTEWGYALHLAGAVIIETRHDGGAIRLARGATIAPEMLEQWVRCITPKALFLQGVSVLHASACSFGDSLVAFCGDSGAGKTTTARAFAAAGRPLHSEDLVVVDPGGEVPAAFIEAEPAIRRWAADSGALLARQADYVIDSRGLRALVCKGRVRALAGLLFVERGRRSGTEVRSEQISPVDSLAGLLQACFLGSADRDSWRVFVRSNTAVARSTRGANLWVPDGIEALTKAAARFDYNASSTS